MSKVMNHSEYIRKTRGMSDDSLRFVINDCRTVLADWPDHPNAGYYQDEIHYCGMELTRRRKNA